LRESIGRWDDAVRLAKASGINSRVSQENFAAAWRAYADECSSEDEDDLSEKYPLNRHGHPAPHRMLGQKVGEQFSEAASRSSSKSTEKQREVLAKLGAAYGLSPEEALSAVDSNNNINTINNNKRVGTTSVPKPLSSLAPEMAPLLPDLKRESQENISPPLPTLDLRTALRLQRRLLEEYRSSDFEAASRVLDSEWQRQMPEPTLEEKMRNIEDLCFERVLSHILVEFGFPSDRKGVTQMKAALAQHLPTSPEARKLQVETSAAVMVGFKL